jgi:serine/threonine-protein kinase
MDLRDQLQLTLGDGYTLERELGGGGMSRVFVAVEKSLGRQVVVKVLPTDMMGQVSIERFKREIMLAARLQHPHIVPLLSAGDSDGLPYFTMPFVEGESLRTRLARHGELPVSDAIRILREIAAALAYAHERGVVHRDIKPDNVLLSGGSAMVTDFGVAKALSASSNADHGGMTSLGVALGTPAYMAPEQATADPAIDHRADVYAFGVLAYELLTSQPPFVGRTPQNLLAAHVSEPPEAIGRRRSSLPPALSALVMRCLEKRPADRPQSASEIVHALDDITTPSGGTQPAVAMPSGEAAPIASSRSMRPMLIGVIVAVVAVGALFAMKGRGGGAGTAGAKTLAVLAFENKSKDSSLDYIADGMSDELRSSLTSVPGLAVKARGSSAHFKSGDADVHEVGSKLSVESVLTGTLSKSGAKFRLVAELVRTSDGNAIWSATYERAANELGAVQDSISRAVVAALRVQSAAAAGAAGGNDARGTANAEAYDLFLRGKHESASLGDSSEFRARDLFVRALAKDPRFARAHAALAEAYVNMIIGGDAPRNATLALARASVAAAVAIDSTVPEIVLARSALFTTDFKFDENERLLRSAVAAHPADPELHAALGTALYYLARIPESIEEARTARRLDPLSVLNLIQLQYELYIIHDFAGSVALTRDILELDPRNTIAILNQGLSDVFLGHADSAVDAFERAAAINATGYGMQLYQTYGYAAAGRWSDAEAMRAKVEKVSKSNSPHFERAYVNLAFDRFDEAAHDLERALDDLEPFVLGNGVPCDPVFDPLKSNASLVKAMKKIWPKICPATMKSPIKPR